MGLPIHMFSHPVSDNITIFALFCVRYNKIRKSHIDIFSLYSYLKENDFFGAEVL